MNSVENSKPLRSYSGGLKVGDKIPDLTINKIINYPKSSFRLSDYRGKKLLIDFWGTYCTSCFEKFPLTDSIQKEFPQSFQVLLVANTGKTETLERIRKALKRFDKSGKAHFSLPSAIYDTVLNNTFPHLGNPHYVWINENGIVKAITGHDEMNRKNLVKFITSGLAPSEQKNDYNFFQPLYTVDFLPVNNLMQFSILIRGFQDGLPVGIARRVINGQRRGSSIMNYDLLSMYKQIGYGIIPEFTPDRLKLEVKDSGLIFYNGPEIDRLSWMRKNLYTYDLVLPEGRFGDFWGKMNSELNANTPYTASIETRKATCWVLEKTADDNLIAAKDTVYENTLGFAGVSKLRGYTLFDLCTYIRESVAKGIIVLDRTAFNKPVNLEFARSPKDLESLQKYLEPYGLRISVTEQPVQLLVIRDNPIKTINN